MADVIKLTSQVVTATPTESVDDPQIIKIAKLTLILADKSVDEGTKRGCLNLAVRMGYISKTDAAMLSLYRSELESFMEDPDEK